MATEKRLISLDEAINATHEEVFWTESEAAAVRSFLAKRPTVDAVKVMHGQWIEHHNEKNGIWHYDCSICDDGYAMTAKDYRPPNYCQNCGAKMDGGTK